MTFGAAPGLGVSTFTIETWFRRDGAGIATNTGTGGVVAIPLVTKGMAEAEGGTVDMNYFLGIRATDNVLVADFEDTATGLNHPVAGTTVIPADGAWHHAAATYDGTTWRLYLDGVAAGAARRSARSRRSSTASSTRRSARALNSTGGIGSQTQGSFNGVLDEARVWNYARSAQQIGRGTDARDPVGARAAADAGASTKVAGRPSPTARATRHRHHRRHELDAGCAGAPFTPPANAAPVAER